jgi:hypothetical protein
LIGAWGKGGLGGLIPQPPDLVLDGRGCRAEFGGDPADEESLCPQDEQPLDREWGQEKLDINARPKRFRSQDRTRRYLSIGQAEAA